MKEIKTFLNEEDYFSYFDQICMDSYLIDYYPLVLVEIKAICIKIKKYISLVNSYNYFEIHSKILGLDARLQIILTLLPTNFEKTYNPFEKITQKEIIECSRKDYKLFSREIFDLKIDGNIPHSLYFSVL
ncbi:DUF7006 family protein [Enterococcus gallinarum]|uniref:DUF7006 family protein n=1 Tax=Enterococcus gallinarum TaxID=1353 RepID=UPI002498C218|nr:hypothetical protein [Enterococcus gallinarum]GMG59771.1 hypothetical protein AH4_31340 [Enterococcus gallinarum]